MKTIDIFSRQASYYAKYRPTYPSEMYKEIMLHVSKNEMAWDCGTGNGQVAVVLAEYFEKVYATDINSAQLINAFKRKNIDYLCNSAEHTIFKQNLFDLVTIAQAIHWFDFSDFYKEVNRILKKNGIIAVIGYGRLKADRKSTETISNFFDEMFGQYFNENRRYVDEKYQTIPFPFERIGNYEYVSKYHWNLKDLQGYLRSWSAVQKYFDEYKTDPTEKIIIELAEDWKTAKEVQFPVFLKLGRLKK